MKKMYLILLLILCDILQCSGVHRPSSQLLLRQKRNWIIDSFTIDEGYQGPFPYPLGKIDIEKDLVLFKIHGQGVDLEPKNVLEINEYTGEITVLRPVDSEEYSTLKLTFQALDRQNHEIDTQLGIHIQIVDSNNNPPIFKLEKYNISIKESTLQGTAVVTIEATDKDRSEKNNKCSLKIISVTPTPKDLEFYLEQIHEQGIGTISFKGCLDHETAQKYTIIVEAKDNGKKTLSSSCTITINIEDGNNHLPVITQQIGPEKVKEGQINVLVSRIQVNDEDTRGTPAWRAKYTIQGDTDNNFRITTDPETNEGLVYVEKPLNYEDAKMKNITITVENEIPYYSCKVERRSTTGLWKVVTKSGSTATRTTVSGVTETELATGASSHQVIVTVEDVNEPPVFDKPSKEVVVTENFGVGKYLETFTAKDPDVTTTNTFKYTIGHDPAGWITVDPDTGNVTTSKVLDRESEFVKDNIYVVTICAVDDGIPKMTSTATLSIHVRDENDHAPSLVLSIIEMCQSDDHSFANITALDSDDEPYGGPFTFKLLGDVAGKWKVDPVVGYSVNLVKEQTVYSENHKLLLEVSDKQGNTAVHSLSVTVCSCVDPKTPNCHLRKSSVTLGAGAVGILLLSMRLIADLLLLALLLSCKKETVEIPDYYCPGQQLKTFNTDNPGKDCPVATVMQNQNQMQETAQVKTVTMSPLINEAVREGSEANSFISESQREGSMA
ncbi:cadherin-like protein 26 [Archocentrus centrarchus]|uniref:cadherin-like protein 26 n=1 Tax=Archocentrus centrarchus TaxID=63155 RepID=UPI0011E9BDD0|nr:cadherin-like protein 26 [Archocentrus centrarchus]